MKISKYLKNIYIVPDFQKQGRNHNPFLVIDPANHESKYDTCKGMHHHNYL